MADVHDHLPEIRILWLRKLAEHHVRHQTHAEAAQCMLEIAKLVPPEDSIPKKLKPLVSLT
jgi:hypothetical protein